MSHCSDDEEISCIPDKKRKKHIFDTDDEDNSITETNSKVLENDIGSQEGTSSTDEMKNEVIREHNYKRKRIKLKSKKHINDIEVRDAVDKHKNTTQSLKHIRKKKKQSKNELADSLTEGKDNTLAQIENTQSLLSDTDVESNRNEDTKQDERKSNERKKIKKMDPMFEIRRESQRMIRESRISLPYHQPKSRSLSEFLHRRKSTPSIPIKPTTHELERVWTIMEKRNEELKTFYKSESDNSDNEGKEEANLVQKYDENMEVSKKQIVEDNKENTNNPSENKENEQKIDECETQKNDVGNNEYEKLIINPCDKQSTEKENVDINYNKNKTNEEQNETKYKKNNFQEEIIEDVIQKNASMRIEDLGNKKQEELENSINNKNELNSSPISTDGLNLSKNEEHTNKQQLKFKKYDTILKERFPTLDLSFKTPSLEGNPEDVLHFETESICNNGLVNLMQRFIKHTSVNAEPEHDKTLQISTLGSIRDDGGEIIALKKETFTIVEKSQQNEYSKLIKPGAKLAYFKNEIKKTMTLKKESQWKSYQEDEAEENHTKELDTSFGEKEEETEDENEDDILTTEMEEIDEEEEIEEDVIIEDNKRKQSEFIDDEAEESDEDEMSSDEENNEELRWTFPNISSSQLERKVSNVADNEIVYDGSKLDEMYSMLGDGDDVNESPSSTFTSENSQLRNYGLTLSQVMNDTQELNEPENVDKTENNEKENTNDSEDEDFQLITRKKVKLMIMSDDESEDENKESGDEENDENVLQVNEENCENYEEEDEEFHELNKDDADYDASDYEDNIGYDSEEEILDTKVNQFFENEAELSESEWGSDDENEKGLDELEEEAGDKDNIDDEKVKEELGKIHMRQLMDDDQKDVKLLQEMLLEDGELHSDTKRQRKFQWKNIDDGEYGLVDSDNSDNEVIDDEDEVGENWRKIRHEREIFLREQAKNVSFHDESNENEKNTESNIVRESRDVAFSPNAKQPFQIRCGSFLSRDNTILSRIAATIGPEKEFATDAPRNGGNFVFSIKSPDVPSKIDKRRVILKSNISDRRVKISKSMSSSILEKLEL